jgi:adenylate cyclase
MTRLRIRVYEGPDLRFDGDADGPLEVGRQRGGEPAPFALLPADGAGSRLVVARQNEENISRTHARFEALASGCVRVFNLSRLRLDCGHGGDLPPGQQRELHLPLTVAVGGRRFVLADPAEAPGPGPAVVAAPPHSGRGDRLLGLSGLTVAPGPGPRCELGPLAGLTAEQVDSVADWLQPVLGALESAVGSANYQADALRAMVEVVGLSNGRVYRYDGRDWHAAAGHFASDRDEGRPASRSVLERVRHEGRTFWESPDIWADPSASLRLAGAVVAAPLLDRQGAVVGVLYGERKLHGPGCRPISKLEAVLVELLANGISAGLARVEREAEAVSARVRFEQFFTPELASRLAAEPDLLAGRDAEVTLLFCDIRGFSRVSERLGPAETVRWVRSIMTALSECVQEEEGTLVDYVGDELIAMWGAPRPQPDQAERAVRAALAMVDRMPGLDAEWRAVTGEPVRVGIGVNTGPARVGDIGSRFKFKYGPLGNTVNLASRVQGATKYLRCDLLVTGETRSRLGPEFVGRRVSKVRVTNIAGAVDLCEVARASDADRADFFRRSQTALETFEAGDPLLAVQYVSRLLLESPDDGPLLMLLSRATDRMLRDEEPFDPVWSLPGK